VIRWGDGVGTHGADIISVNAKTGRVTLWDTKWRTNPTNIGPSRTFTKTETLENAVQQARDAIREAEHIPLEIREKALESLNSGAYSKHTPGVGPGARSSGIGFQDYPIETP